MAIKTKEEKFKLYFIAIIPSAPVYEDVQELKLYFKEQYNSKASLNSPPHITLHMPFQWKEEKENDLKEHLQFFAKTLHAFSIQLNNFSSFPPRVIFINVMKNEALERTQRELHRFCKLELNVFNADYKDQPYHPHLTLAFRDLKKINYQRAWEEFSTKIYNADFLADKLVLLKHNGKIWQACHEFSLVRT